MQTYDFIMLFVLGGLTIYGYSKGMAWQIAYLTSLVASYFVAAKFSPQLAPMFGDAAPWNKFVAMLAIYAGTSLAIWMVFRMIRGGIDKVRLQSFDHQMGAIVGAARGVLWCVGLTFFAVTLLPEAQKRQIIGTRSGYYIAKLLDKSHAVVPPEVHQVIGPHLDRLENELNQGQSYPTGDAQPGGWPQATGNSSTGSASTANGATNNLWPSSAQQPSASQPQAGGWPSTPTSSGTPAQPAAWPQQPASNNGWGR